MSLVPFIWCINEAALYKPNDVGLSPANLKHKPHMTNAAFHRAGPLVRRNGAAIDTVLQPVPFPKYS